MVDNETSEGAGGSSSNPKLAVHEMTLVNYAGWLEGTSAVMHKCSDLLIMYCQPDASGYGSEVPLINDTARMLHNVCTAAVLARASELSVAGTRLHEMAQGLTQVAANYAKTDVQVVTRFGQVNSMVEPSLPVNYDLEARPQR